MGISSQLKHWSSSAVAATIARVLRHCTEMESEKSSVDRHGQSEVAFALCPLLVFDLRPRLQAIASHKRAPPTQAPPRPLTPQAAFDPAHP